jgi:2',3'-cyclic-nucleotide 2'-phosphodiesterase (5'-nucleotidase family)
MGTFHDIWRNIRTTDSGMTRSSKSLIVLIVLLAACSSRSENTELSETLTFIHLNDTYRIDAVEDGKAGGFGRVVTIIRELRKNGHDVRILHGGDFLFPSLESQLWRGEQMVEALNFMDDIAPMYVVPGNHDIDPRTPAVLVNAVRQSRFEWLGSNWRLLTGEDDVDRRLRDRFIVEFGDRKIGIFALTAHADDGGNDRDYAPIDKRYLPIAEQAIKDFEAESVDAIFGLTHLYVSTDRQIATLKARHPRFLLIAGGHDHEAAHEPATEASAEVVKGASNARKIWQIDVSFSEGGAIPEVTTHLINIDNSIAKDANYQKLATRWRQKLLDRMPFLAAKVGMASVSMDAREETIRSRESAWGNFIVDQMRSAFGEPAADFAFINSGTLRIDDYIADDVTFEDIGRTFGFSSYLRHLVLSGSDFKALLEVGYRGTGSQGYFPQISGFRVCVDRSRPEGRRIVQLQVPAGDGWDDIDSGKDYLVVAPDFLYRGGDGYDFSRARDVSRPASELKYLVLDAIIRAQAAGETIGRPVDALNPRIATLRDDQPTCFD